MHSRAIFAALALGLALAAACGGKSTFPPPKPPVTETTSAPAPSATQAPSDTTAEPTSGVNVSDEVRRLCGIVGGIEEAPKFDYDSSDLSPKERDVLAQLARCMTEGPLKGKNVLLVGRADPRGEQEYNMQLGERRADMVDRYLLGLGVDRGRLTVTSRGEIDATGRDEEGWRKDRRVDITVAK